MTQRPTRLLLALILGGLLAGCENDGAAYAISGRNHTITLVREQAAPWSSEIDQALVVARFPECQRRWPIHKGALEGTLLELWQVRGKLFVARQGAHWYAVGTEQCQVQTMEPTGDTPPGVLLGRFERHGGALRFKPESAASATEP